jgi:hypothetical protein
MKQIITIKQDIQIEFENEESRKAAIAQILGNTNWIHVSYGRIQNLPIQYNLQKTDNISIVSSYPLCENEK